MSDKHHTIPTHPADPAANHDEDKVVSTLR